jgi:heme-degrading monooxygenase HmoA
MSATCTHQPLDGARGRRDALTVEPPTEKANTLGDAGRMGEQVDPVMPALQGGTMIMRIWRTQVDEARAAEYERFAAQQSLPMFRAHQGFEGHLFGRRGGDCVVVTIWEDDAAADALEASPRYRETVARINAAGFLTGPSQVDRFRLHGDMAP